MSDNVKQSGVFRDWIPAGEDPGAFGTGTFQDFVPTPEPKPQVVEEVKPEPKPAKAKK